jgi:hypothetical protein
VALPVGKIASNGVVFGSQEQGNAMNIYQMRHAILAQHMGRRVTPAQLKAELLEKFQRQAQPSGL